MKRRDALKLTMFGGAFLTEAVTLIDQIDFSNSAIEGSTDEEAHIATKGSKPGALAIAFGPIRGSRDFPLREGENKTVIASDGALIYFVWPSERGDARGYIKPFTPDVNPDKLVFRLRMGRPEPPYYLRWRKGDYYLYTPPGALVRRAGELIAVRDDSEKAESAHLQALSDMRMAVLINLTFSGKGQEVLDDLCELDNKIRRCQDGLRQYWNEYRELLKRSRS